MKISYKVLKKYIPDIPSVEEVAEMLVMHTAEVEEIHELGSHLTQVFTGKIVSHSKHPDADKLNICQVEVNGETRQIICGAPNVRDNLIVAVALPGAQLKEDFTIQKSKIRGETSEGMLCSEDELGLTQERQDGIMELPESTPLGICVRELFGMDDAILEVDNKAINHRPDLFSHIGIAREIEAIRGKKLGYIMARSDFEHLPDIGITNDIPQVVKRFMGLKVSGVQNIESPDYIKEVLTSHDIEPKGLLIDITNYSLYLYGQPTHCFDSDKLTGNLHSRYARDGETLEALNGKTYTLTPQDIVIADDNGPVALGGVIGGQASAVSNATSTIIIESAWFDQAVVRNTGKRLGLRTDALNVFEKDLVVSLRDTGTSLIVKELEAHFPDMKLEGYTDVYPHPEDATVIAFKKERINALVGKDYSEKEILDILDRLFIHHEGGKLHIPLWRKDITHIADIAEEVARIDGYGNITSTVPRINNGAITQSASYRFTRKVRNFLVAKGMFELYTYSFVNQQLMEKCLGDVSQAPALKNTLSEELTHMRPSLVPHLLSAISENYRDFGDMQVFENEKVFSNINNAIDEKNQLAILIYEKNSEDLYHKAQNIIEDILSSFGLQNFEYKTSYSLPSFAHNGRSSELILRGKSLAFLGEISPKVLHNFEIPGRVAFLQIESDILSSMIDSIVKYKEISQFQENNFDLSFVVDKKISGSMIQNTIHKTDSRITKVELFDIYESEEKLPGQRSISFKIYIQSLSETLDDTVKNELIDMIVKRVEAKSGKLR